MPSFDIVSEVNKVEMKNALEQSNKEIANRFDFKGSDARIEEAELTLTVYADDDFKLKQVMDVFTGKCAKRGVDVRALDPKDVEDGLRAAAAVGDDTLQKQSQGRVMPDAFTHGTSEQRMRWFRAGVENGDPAACDTFSASRL